MRLVLLLIVVAAIGLAARQMLKESVPVAVPEAGQPVAAPASAEALRQFGQDVQSLTNDAAAERARRSEEATR
jgi:uncharacterized protein (DUF697 family)